MKIVLHKTLCLLAVAGLSIVAGYAQKSGQVPENLKPVKNVVIMIPDGTSTSVLSLARWYQSYNSPDLVWLNVDGLITGLVKTHSSDAPIGDSAPTSSTYATGVVSQSGYVATYPEKTPNDIVAVDAQRANMPAMTILEAAKLQGRSTGLVFTCDFTHATPADFSAHTPYRSDRVTIAHQMAYNNVDVVFGGGADYLLPELRQHLAKQGYDTIFNDYAKFKAFNGTKVWGLMSPKDVPYDIDRNPASDPSLAEMTKKALETLSKNEKGFFLMVEGSKVDFAAHSNDPIGIATDFIAFDKAVKEVLEFAKKNGETAIIIMPDHGNSGVNIGNRASSSGYDKLSKRELFEPLVKCKLTTVGFTEKLMEGKGYDEAFVRRQFSEHMGIDDLTLPELQSLKSPIRSKNSTNIAKAVVDIVNARTFIGFTTGGHTAEDVFLATYHPQGQTLSGVVLNTDINRYACQLLGVGNLQDSTAKYFVGHKTLFPESDYTVKWENKKDKTPTLSITAKASKKTMTVKAFQNVILVGGEKDKKRTEVPLKSVAVYVEKNEEFYLPRDLKAVLDKK